MPVTDLLIQRGSSANLSHAQSKPLANASQVRLPSLSLFSQRTRLCNSLYCISKIATATLVTQSVLENGFC